MKPPRGYIQPAALGLFDAPPRLEQIRRLGDPLAALAAVRDWPIFMPVLARLPRAAPQAPGGRPAYPPRRLFKILVLQSLYGLSAAPAQFQILDRRRFHPFLGWTAADLVPDPNTLRAFREQLTAAELFRELLAAFNPRLTDRGFITRKGQIIDASLVAVPRPRHRRLENAASKGGEVPAGWEQEPKRLAHRDLDARWPKKNEPNYDGYKDHVVADLTRKLIVRAAVTAASEQDRQARDSLTCLGEPETWADSASAGAPCQALFTAKGITAHVGAKGTRGQALTKGQQRSNRAKSRHRGRVEHLFGFMTGRMQAMCQRVVGFARNRAGIRLANLVYNLARTAQLMRFNLWGRKTPQLV